MRSPSTLTVVVIIAASLSVAHGTLNANSPQSPSSAAPQLSGHSGTSSDRVMSPAVVAMWTATIAEPTTTLDLLVLWRGTPGWFFAGNMHSGGGGGSRQAVSVSAHYGSVDLKMWFDGATGAASVQDQEVRLNGDNVVLVDEVDAVGGPKIVGTKKIDPAMPDGKRIDLLIRRSPELHSFMRCDVRLPDVGQQRMMDLLCGQIIPK